MKSEWITLAVAAALGFCLGTAAAETPQENLDTVFGSDIRAAAATPDKADDVALAGRMVEAAGKFGSDVQTRIFFCRKAYDLAMKDPAGYSTAAEAARALLKDAPDEKPACQTMLARALDERFQATAEGARFDLGEELFDVLLAMGDDRAAARQFFKATELYGQALKIARTNKSDRANDAQRKLDWASGGQSVAANLERLQRNYQAKPGDAAIARSLAMLFVGEFNSPQDAAAYAQASGDATLKRMVPLAAQAADRMDEANCQALAGWYRELAKAATLGREAALKRAQAYLQRYLELHTTGDAMKVKAEAELADVTKALDALRPAGERLRGQWVDLLALVNLKQDVVSGKWSLSPDGLVSPDSMAGIRLPASPQASYELEVVMERIGGDNSAFVFLPVGGSRMICYHVGGSVPYYSSTYGYGGYGGTAIRKYGPFKGGSGRPAMAGFETIQGKFIASNDAARELKLDNNVKMTWLLKVVLDGDSRVTLQSDLDGKEFVKWQGTTSVLALPSHCRLDSRGLGLGVSKTSWQFHSVRLKALSGGLKLRGGETAEPPPSAGLLTPVSATAAKTPAETIRTPAAAEKPATSTDEAAANTALKMAETLREQKKRDFAKRRYREIVQKYPNTKAAREAAKALLEIKVEEEDEGIH